MIAKIFSNHPDVAFVKMENAIDNQTRTNAECIGSMKDLGNRVLQVAGDASNG
jgi:hypothetical protein